MDQLVVPDPAPRLALQTDQALGEQVVARPVSPVPVVGRRGGRQIGVAQILVGAHDRPDVAGARVLPRPVFPRVVPELARLGHGVEPPLQSAGDGVEAPDVARRLLPLLEAVAGEDADDDRVAADQRRRRPAVLVEVRHALREVDLAALPELAQRIAGAGVEGDEMLAAHDEDPLVVAFRVVPVADAAGGTAARPAGAVLERAVDPRRLARRRVDGGRLPQVGAHEQTVADHQRRGEQRGIELQVRVLVDQVVVDRPPTPGDVEILHVVGADLIQRRVLRAARLPGVAAPFAARRALLRDRGRRPPQHERAKDADSRQRRPESRHGRSPSLRRSRPVHCDRGSANVTSMLLPIGASSSGA